MTMEEAMTDYYAKYKPKSIKDNEERKRREKIIFSGFVVVVMGMIVYFYRK